MKMSILAHLSIEQAEKFLVIVGILGQKMRFLGSVALLLHNTLKWSEFLGISFFCVVLVAQGIHAMGFKRA